MAYTSEDLEGLTTQFDDLDLYEPPTGRYHIFVNGMAEGLTLLHKLVLMARRRPEVIPRIQELAQDPNELNRSCNYGYTALMLACRNTNTVSTEEVVSILIAAGANIDQQSEYGRSALMEAVENAGNESTEETVRMLIAAGANVNLHEYYGLSCLMMAAAGSGLYSSEETVRMLIAAGADINYESPDGSVLLRAVTSGQSTDATIMLLLNAGAVLGGSGTDLRSVLHYYLGRPSPSLSMVIMLHERGYRLGHRAWEYARISTEIRQGMLVYYLNDYPASTLIISGNHNLWEYFNELKYVQAYQQERIRIFRRILTKLAFHRNQIRYHPDSISQKIRNLGYRIRTNQPIDTLDPIIVDFLSITSPDDLIPKVIAYMED